MSNLRDRLLAAITATPPEKRGYSMRNLRGVYGAAQVSFTDLLTDLAPFLEAEIAAMQARIDLLVADEPTGAYQEGLAAGRREAQAEIARLNADLARLGALKTEEVAGVLERFRAAFGVSVPPVPQGLEVCNGDKCETCVNYEIERREAINRERWARTFPSVPWIADEQDRTNYLLNEHDRASGKMET